MRRAERRLAPAAKKSSRLCPIREIAHCTDTTSIQQPMLAQRSYARPKRPRIHGGLSMIKPCTKNATLKQGWIDLSERLVFFWQHYVLCTILVD